MTVDTLTAESPTIDDDTQVVPGPSGLSDAATDLAGTPATAPADSPGEAGDAPVDEAAAKPKRGRPKTAAPKKAKTMELTLTVTGTADGEWTAELKQGSSYLARSLAVAAAAVSRAAKELHEDLSGPIDEVIDAAREQQAARVAALEAELEAARKALADLAD